MSPSLEVVSKLHPMSDSCVVDLLKILLIPPQAGLRFFIGLRLALEHDLGF